ncbi:MAG: MFS transporter [Armatimonadota bacterium]
MGSEEKANIRGRFLRLATASAFASLLSYAVVLLITPACNNEIAASYNASLGQLGELSLATMLGFFVTVIPAGRFADLRGKLPAMTAGCASMAVGAILFAQTGDFRLAILGSALFGIGGGLSEANSMALLADLFTDSRRTSIMNLAQAMFGIGAVVSPIGIGVLLRSGLGWRTGYVGACVICAFAAALNLSAALMHGEKHTANPAERVRARQIVRDPLVICLGFGIFLYVGAEIGQSTWLSVYFKRFLGASDAFAASSPSLMWVGIGLGRVTAAWASRRAADATLVCWATALAAAGQGALLIGGGPLLGTGAAFALGFFLGPIFPTVISRASGIHPQASGVVTAVVVAAGSLGAAAFPPIIGWAADSIGLRTALWICFAVLCADLVVFAWVRARVQSREPGL